ncbi:hypothetical protein ACH5RR_007757 [Cinchona calisaya]|uniref:TSL-kinase interacting protein 1 n=1 Tax=Cinchona calisaya TaxID=153742 RepID=A0ABD3ADA2_9GENT
MEQQISLDCNSCLHPENLVKGEGAPCSTKSFQDHTASVRPVKRPTRQWAAWTHQEEESFFSALRQVGKNFEKITCRVQSKNKDQVRHYYYRLVRRMNKLLGPELCLDAKNSKDTNAAMLRWWSLLEKYSCKASKLHLKPRRFKLFVDTLENQLLKLKDRKKNVRKRASQGENTSITVPTSLPNQGKISGHESCVVKDVLVDSQNIQKLGTGKGSSLQRHLNTGVNRGPYKAGSSTLKAARHQRKTGAVSKAAYKRWEKAAIAGVSLVADAAEHLERATIDKEVEHVEETHVQNGFDYCGKDAPMPNNMQSSMKLKLQLFPVDEATRRALEMDSHNPYLELTLSTRKKISSVLDHLNRKWGQSSIACGELMLLPYFVEQANLYGCQKWTKDSVLSAADVYLLIGKPPVFRLRYGWFRHAEPGLATFQAPLSCTTQQKTGTWTGNEQIVDTTPKSSPPAYQNSENLLGICEDWQAATKEATLISSSRIPNETIGCASTSSDINMARSSNQASALVLNGRESAAGTIVVQEENTDDLTTQKTAALSAGEWADSLTNISVGDLLTEASHNVEVNGIDSPVLRNSYCHQQIPFSSDSFDAAIAAHIYKHQNRSASQLPLFSDTSSIWDGEETCDAFVFQKNSVFTMEVQSASKKSPPETSKENARTSSAASGRALESDPKEPVTDDPMQGDFVDNFNSDEHSYENTVRDLNGVTDIYWPDSLGALDLDISSCRYRSDDLILSDSLGGLNRLIASSLDAFQSCSFFGSDKKESASAVEGGEIAPDLKISTQV